MQNRIKKAPAYEEDTDIPGEAEGDKANRFWRKYLQRDNSPITDLFGGQLQSTVHCHQCKGNFTTYEPFWDLSVPIAKEGKTGISAWLSGKTVPSTIQDCLQAFTGDEVLQVNTRASWLHSCGFLQCSCTDQGELCCLPRACLCCTVLSDTLLRQRLYCSQACIHKVRCMLRCRSGNRERYLCCQPRNGPVHIPLPAQSR